MTGNTRDLRVLLGSRYPLVVAVTQDETHFMTLMRRAASTLGLPVWTWSVTEGLRRDQAADSAYESRDPNKALQFVAAQEAAAVFVFRDFSAPLREPVVVRRLKELAQSARPGTTVVVTIPSGEIPSELEGVAMRWEHQPPTRAEMGELVRQTLTTLAERDVRIDLAEAQIEELIEACRGLSAVEAGRLVQEAAFRDGAVGDGDIEYVRTAKAQLLSIGGPLELVSTTSGALDQVGGLARLKEWLSLRGKAFQPEARDFGLEAPKGVLLTGVPGCGKSLVARTLAQAWRMPLLLLDPSRLYGPFVGESEKRLHDALVSVEAMAPAVLWIDEIEKGLAAGSESDSGVSQRLRGTFLRWMQDRPEGVFIVATSNDVLSLPPEFLRKGRFDEIFFVDLPGSEERALIFGLHLARRKRDPASFDLDALAGATDGFSGAEIEACVAGALYRVFGEGTDIATQDLLAEIGGTVPLSRTRAEDISRLRDWARGRTVPAS